MINLVIPIPYYHESYKPLMLEYIAASIFYECDLFEEYLGDIILENVTPFTEYDFKNEKERLNKLKLYYWKPIERFFKEELTNVDINSYNYQLDTMCEMFKVALEFDFNDIDNRAKIMEIVLDTIIGNDEEYLISSIDELYQDIPNSDISRDTMIEKAFKLTDKLKYPVVELIAPNCNDYYELIEVIAVNRDLTVLTFIDNSE